MSFSDAVQATGLLAAPSHEVSTKNRKIEARRLNEREASQGQLARRLRPFTSRVRAYGALAIALCAECALSIHLMLTNTAFLDEATYLSAGRVLWHNLLHGGPDMHYSSYFSGAPALYPLVAAGADAVGGLDGARALSLAFMCVTIIALFRSTSILFGRAAAGWAVLLFVSVEGTQFLGAFATYDAMSLMLLSLGLWIICRFGVIDRQRAHAGALLAAPVIVLANATKYASALYDPVLVALLVLIVASRSGWREGIRIGLILCSLVAAAIGSALALAGQTYLAGIGYTTLARAKGNSSASDVLGDSLRWVGPIAGLALIAAVVAVVRMTRSRDFAAGDRANAFAMPLAILVLCSAVFLAPLNQTRILTTVSLQKHVTFGALLSVMAVGKLATTVSGLRVRAVWRWLPVLAVVGALTWVGFLQSERLFQAWTNSSRLDATLQPYVQNSKDLVLADDSEVPEYYLGDRLSPNVWHDTYSFVYHVPGTTTELRDNQAYRSAIAHNAFRVIALNFGAERATDNVIHAAIQKNPHYKYLTSVPVSDIYGKSAVVVWVNTSRKWDR